MVLPKWYMQSSDYASIVVASRVLTASQFVSADVDTRECGFKRQHPSLIRCSTILPIHCTYCNFKTDLKITLRSTTLAILIFRNNGPVCGIATVFVIPCTPRCEVIEEDNSAVFYAITTSISGGTLLRKPSPKTF
jgi:hypothetical protein